MRMVITKYWVYLSFSLMFFLSCKKDNSSIRSDADLIKIFPAASSNVNVGLTKLTDGNLLLAGYLYGVDTPHWTLIKCSDEGDLIWQKFLTNDYHFTIRKVLTQSDGAVIIVGNSSCTTCSFYEINLIKIDASGNIVWSRIYNNLTPGYPTTLAISYNSEGNIVVIGTIFNNDKNFLLLFSPDGNFILKKYFLPKTILPYDDFFNYYLTEDSLTKDLFLQGTAYSNFLPYYKANYIEKLSGSGTLKWIKDNPSDSTDTFPLGIYLNGDKIYSLSNRGNYRPTATFTVNGLSYIGTLNLYLDVRDTSGNYISTNLIDGLPDDVVYSTSVKTNDGGYLLTGTNPVQGYRLIFPASIFLAKLDQNFKLQWTKKIKTNNSSNAVETIELNNSYYTSGSFVFHDSLYNMILTRTSN